MQKVAEVLEGLRTERARLLVELAGVDRAIAALEEVLGIRADPAAAPAPAPEEPAHAEPEVAPAPPAPPRPAGPYAKAAGLYEAVAAYLREAGEPRTARQIADALRAGGYPTRATNFQSTVRTMLLRDGVLPLVRHSPGRTPRPLGREELNDAFTHGVDGTTRPADATAHARDVTMHSLDALKHHSHALLHPLHALLRRLHALLRRAHA